MSSDRTKHTHKCTQRHIEYFLRFEWQHALEGVCFTFPTPDTDVELWPNINLTPKLLVIVSISLFVLREWRENSTNGWWPKYRSKGWWCHGQMRCSTEIYSNLNLSLLYLSLKVCCFCLSLIVTSSGCN